MTDGDAVREVVAPAGGAGDSSLSIGAAGVSASADGTVALPLSPGVVAERRRDVVAVSGGLLVREHAASPRDSARRRALALADMLTVAVAYGVMAAALGHRTPAPTDAALVAALPAWVLLNKLIGLYDRDAHVINKSTLDEVPRLFQSIALGVSALFILTPLLPNTTLGRGQAVVFALAAAVSMPLGRSAARWVVRRTHSPERCLIVGSGTVANIVAHKLNTHRESGAELVGFVDAPALQADGDGGLPWLGDLDRFEQTCRENDVERVIIAFSSIAHEQLLDVIRMSKRLGLKITVVPRLFEVLGHAVEIDQLQGMTLLGLRGFGRTRSSLAVKRCIDVTGALIGLVLLTPLLLVIALAIKLTSPGPVLFAQRRMGRNNQAFKLFKFRTMVPGAPALKASLAHLNEAEAPMFKIANDPRVTRVGRFLRRTSLDELPQLWNVVRGDMSLVGPRPLVPSENDQLIGWHRARLELTPGLTGPWQVLGRTAIPFQEMVKLDYLYVADWSLWNDLKLLIRTAPAVFQGRGV